MSSGTSSRGVAGAREGGLKSQGAADFNVASATAKTSFNAISEAEAEKQVQVAHAVGRAGLVVAATELLLRTISRYECGLALQRIEQAAEARPRGGAEVKSAVLTSQGVNECMLEYPYRCMCSCSCVGIAAGCIL